MTFDPTPTERPAVSRNGVELAKLRVLEEALRKKMPKGFEWNFAHVQKQSHCGTVGCAIGMARHLGLLPDYGVFSVFGLQRDEIWRVFGNNTTYGQRRRHSVTPIMVADELARIIRREETTT